MYRKFPLCHASLASITLHIKRCKWCRMRGNLVRKNIWHGGTTRLPRANHIKPYAYIWMYICLCMHMLRNKLWGQGLFCRRYVHFFRSDIIFDSVLINRKCETKPDDQYEYQYKISSDVPWKSLFDNLRTYYVIHRQLCILYAAATSTPQDLEQRQPGKRHFVGRYGHCGSCSAVQFKLDQFSPKSAQ